MDYREAAQKTYETNMQLKVIQVQQQQEEEEKQKMSKQRDLMQAIYEEKKHISYEKRERSDKVMGLMIDKMQQGDTNKRIQ